VKPRVQPRAGFTLIELLMVVVVVGILAGVAMPNLMEAVYRADASRVASDARTVNLAVRTYIEDTGSLPEGAGWGKVPPQLQSYLPEAMPFSYRSLQYRVVVQKQKGTVRLEAKYPKNDPIGLALQGFRGASVTWTKSKTTFWYEG